MTTVAWDGHVLATDSRINGSRSYSGEKIWKLPNGIIFAGGGDRQIVLAVKNYLSLLNSERFTEPDPFSYQMPTKPTLSSDFSGLLVVRKKAYRLEHLIEPWEVPARFACGSGCDFATSAMALGMNAIEAVQFAMRFDINTGGEVQHFVAE
jgi:hypothetical protein